MNRAIRKLHQRRCALKNTSRGGGFGVVAPLAPTANYVPEYRYYSDCADQLRPGELTTTARPELAQTAMAGGNGIRRALNRLTRRVGGFRRGCGCGMMRGGGGCGCNLRRRYTLRGGNRGFGVFPGMNVGGTGPNVGAANLGLPCDARAGSANPFGPVYPGPDMRAPPDVYSITPNTGAAALPQSGGNHSDVFADPAFQAPARFPFHATQAGGNYGGNAYDASCYRAPGSQMPVYPASSAGFHFEPSIKSGATLPDGVTAYNVVVPHVARLGGGYGRTKKTMRSQNKVGTRRHR